MVASRRRLSLGAASLGITCSLSFALVACGEDGVTPDCPPMPLYDVRDAAAASDDEVLEARAAAVDAGCLTDLGVAASPD